LSEAKLSEALIVRRRDDIFNLRARLRFQFRQRVDQHSLVGIMFAAALSSARAAGPLIQSRKIALVSNSAAGGNPGTAL
jgi:hypothetical protein